MLRGPAALCFVVCAAGCSGGTNDGSIETCKTEPPLGYTPGTAPPTNNSAAIEGPPLGWGRHQSWCDVRRLVPVDIIGISADLEVGPAFVMRPSPLIVGVVSVLVPVKNIGTTQLCWGLGSRLIWRNAAGTEISSNTVLIMGSVGRIGLSYSATCLLPGDVAYLPDGDVSLDEPLWDQLARIEVTFPTVVPGVDVPLSSLLPESYAVAGDTATVTFRNVGTRAAPTGGSRVGHFLLLDAAGLPVDWGLFDIGPEVTIQVGETGTVSATGLPSGMPGPATRMRPLLDFSQII